MRFAMVPVAFLLATGGCRAADKTAALDGVVSAFAAQGFAGEILAGSATALAYHRSVGAPGRPHGPGERWRWASVTKQLAATLVMQDVAAHRLSLDDTLSRRLPAFTGATAGRITLRMLLQHTSGLPNPDDTDAPGTSMPAFYRRHEANAGGTKDALGFCAGKPKAVPPASFSYDNCDTIVLGAVLEAADGQPFATLLRTRIAAPAKLDSLSMAEAGHAAPATVRGTMEDGSAEPDFDLATFGPSGAATGTASDLFVFDQSLLAYRFLPREMSAQAWAGDPKLGYVALGAWGFPAALKGCKGRVQLVERRGEIGGVEVRNVLAPELGRALVVFADRAGLPFGEIWQGTGFTYALASAAFCTDAPAAP